MNKLSRRRMLGGMAALPLLTLPAQMATPTVRKKFLFVLVHGAWHGGWCWKKLSPLLRSAGHEVYAPSLTGMGGRSGLLQPGINLDTHIQDITAVLQYEDLREVILVGHSYGGMVVTGVAEKVPERLSRLVYLDAFLPEDGRAIKDYAPVTPVPADGWRVPPLGPPSAFGVTDPRDIAWMLPRLGDQPLQTLTQPLRISGALTRSLPRAFIQFSKTPWFVEAAERAKRDGFVYKELFSAGHDAMVTQPAGLARLLLELV